MLSRFRRIAPRPDGTRLRCHDNPLEAGFRDTRRSGIHDLAPRSSPPSRGRHGNDEGDERISSYLVFGDGANSGFFSVDAVESRSGLGADLQEREQKGWQRCERSPPAAVARREGGGGNLVSRDAVRQCYQPLLSTWPPAASVRAVSMALGAHMMDAKLLLPIIDRSGKLIAIRNSAGKV